MSATRNRLFVAVFSLVLHHAGVASGAEPLPIPARDYPVVIMQGFASAVAFEDVERVAIETFKRPLDARISPSGALMVRGLPPKITRVVGCRASDLQLEDARITPPDFANVWLVKVRGSFTVSHVGDVDDVEGYLLIHPESGAVIQSGVFVPSP